MVGGTVQSFAAEPSEQTKDELAELVAIAAIASLSSDRRTALVREILGITAGSVAASTLASFKHWSHRRLAAARNRSPLSATGTLGERELSITISIASTGKVDIIHADARQTSGIDFSMNAIQSQVTTLTSDDMAERLTAGFATAVRDAIRDTHALGLAVSGYENGIAIEILPDGTKRPIDETIEWSPSAWSHRARG